MLWERINVNRYYIKADLFEIKTEKEIRSVEQSLIIERFYRRIQRPRIYEMDMGVAQRLILKINLNKTHFFLDETIVGKLTFLMTNFIFEKIEIYMKKIEMAGDENIEEEVVCQHELILDRNPEEGNFNEKL